MKAAPFVVGETEMKGELPSLFSSQTVTPWGVCWGGWGVRGGGPERVGPLPGPGASSEHILCATPLLGRFDDTASEGSLTATVAITTQSCSADLSEAWLPGQYEGKESSAYKIQCSQHGFQAEKRPKGEERMSLNGLRFPHATRRLSQAVPGCQLSGPQPVRPPMGCAGVSTHETCCPAIARDRSLPRPPAPPPPRRASLVGVSVTMVINMTSFFYTALARSRAPILINESIFRTTPRREGPLRSPNYRRGNLGKGGNVTEPASLPFTGSRESGDRDSVGLCHPPRDAGGAIRWFLRPLPAQSAGHSASS